MTSGRTLLFAALVCVIASAPSTSAKGPVQVELWRLDCGRFEVKNIGGKPRTLSNGCYLIRHGSEYMLWDAGLEDELVGKPDISDSQTISLERALPPQLAEIGVEPERIRRLGISHHHGDHIGQAARFLGATLLIGREDWAEIRANREEAALVQPWIDGLAPVTEIDRDHDVFGDGRVIVVDTPGHTPGHQSLLIHLASGAVLLTGDAVHFRDQLERRQPSGNHIDKIVGSLSIDRMLRIERDVPARLIVQHDPGDIENLPTFPLSLR